MRFRKLKTASIFCIAIGLLIDTQTSIFSRYWYKSPALPARSASVATDRNAPVVTHLQTATPTSMPTPLPTKTPELKFPAGKPKALIHMMVQDPNLSEGKDKARALRRMPQLKKTLGLLDRNFIAKYKYPLVFFVNQGFSEETRNLVTSWCPSSTVTFIEMPGFHRPANISYSELTAKVPGCDRGCAAHNLGNQRINSTVCSKALTVALVLELVVKYPTECLTSVPTLCFTCIGLATNTCAAFKLRRFMTTRYSMVSNILGELMMIRASFHRQAASLLFLIPFPVPPIPAGCPPAFPPLLCSAA